MKGRKIMMKKRKLNLPNALSLLRVILVPFFMAAIIFMNGKFGIWGRVVPAIIFAVARRIFK